MTILDRDVTQADEVRADCIPCRPCSPFLIPNDPFSTMPILPPEPDCHPPDLLDLPSSEEQTWWLVYTKSRQEKQMMRRLRRLDLPHYAPQIPQRRRSPSGRIRTSYTPLFNNYVFLCGDNDVRYQAICTGCVIKATEITETERFLADLRQVRDLVAMDVPLTVESRLGAGQDVRVRTGPFAGYEGTILRREQETRLLVCVRFMDQGVSVKLDDCQLEPIGQRHAEPAPSTADGE